MSSINYSTDFTEKAYQVIVFKLAIAFDLSQLT